MVAYVKEKEEDENDGKRKKFVMPMFNDKRFREANKKQVEEMLKEGLSKKLSLTQKMLSDPIKMAEAKFAAEITITGPTTLGITCLNINLKLE